jgi:hypothetical protein
MNYYDAFLVLLIIIKIVLVVSAVLNRFHVYDGLTSRVLVVARTAFDVLMCLLLMFLFNPFYTKLHKINYETCVFIFVFAVLTLVHTLVELSPKKNEQ